MFSILLVSVFATINVSTNITDIIIIVYFKLTYISIIPLLKCKFNTSFHKFSCNCIIGQFDIITSKNNIFITIDQFQSDSKRKESAEKGLEAYSSVSLIATRDLPPSHPIRRGLALNFSGECVCV